MNTPPGSETAHAELPLIVAVHGWGSDQRVFTALALALQGRARLMALDLPGFGDRQQEPFPGDGQQLVACLLPRVPAGAILLGWSLGGAIATLLAAAAPGRVRALVTLATNPCFKARADWPCAMAAELCDGFEAGLRADPARQLQRFHALQAQGDREPRELVRMLRTATAGCASAPALAAALDLLMRLDVRATLQSLSLPCLHIHAAGDALVPPAVADALRELQPAACGWTVPAAGHALPVTHAAVIATRVHDFLAVHGLTGQRATRSKEAVARSFARAAPAYERAAHVQRRIGESALGLLPDTASAVLDLGCGTGQFMPALQVRYPQARLHGLDIAEGMLAVARQRTDVQAEWHAGDAEDLPFTAASFDLVFSSLVMQWCEQPARFLAEVARVLRPGGRAVIATLGPDTLWELRAAWRAVDDRVHVNDFHPAASLAAAVADSGLQVRAWQQQQLLPRVEDVLMLARELRAIGAHNLNSGRLAGLAGRGRWRRLAEAYASLCGDDGGGLPATYQVMLLQLEKPHGD